MVRTVCLKNFDFASQTDKGKVRDRNEDFLAYFDTFNGHVFVVCDGMGGHNAGDVASELAVESIGRIFSERYFSNPFEAIEEALIFANKMVYKHAVGNDYLAGMGTTVVLVLIRDDKIYFGHAGDSRLYLYKKDTLEQCTEDHSHIQQLINRGLITKKEAENHPKRNEITLALGLSMKFEPEVSPKAIVPDDGDTLLLCTDGLSNVLKDDEITELLDNDSNLNDRANKLIQTANKKGGPDNISVQLIRFHNLGFENELENESPKQLFERIRSLMSVKKIAYLLVLLFVLGSSFFIGVYERPQIISYNKKNGKTIEQSDLIIAYLLKPEDDIKRIAKRFNTGEEFLKRLNPNYENAKPGMHIKIPARYLHVVQQSDELPLIVAKYACDEIDILKANDLGGRRLMPGWELIIPVRKNEQ